MLVRILGCLLILAVRGGPAAAIPTSLVIIPTAETVGDRGFKTEMDFFGQPSELVSDERYFGTEFGWGSRFEGGLNYDFSREPTTTWFIDAKYLIAAGRAAAAVGLFNVGMHLPPSPYVIGKIQMGTCRLHTGSMLINGSGRLMVGVDTGFNRTWTFMADYTSGPAAQSSAGVNCRFSPSLGVMFGGVFPNSGGASMLTLQIVYSGSF